MANFDNKFNNIVIEIGKNTVKDIATNGIKAGLYLTLGQIPIKSDEQSSVFNYLYEPTIPTDIPGTGCVQMHSEDFKFDIVSATVSTSISHRWTHSTPKGFTSSNNEYFGQNPVQTSLDFLIFDKLNKKPDAVLKLFIDYLELNRDIRISSPSNANKIGSYFITDYSVNSDYQNKNYYSLKINALEDKLIFLEETIGQKFLGKKQNINQSFKSDLKKITDIKK